LLKGETVMAARRIRVAIGAKYDRTRALESEDGPVTCVVQPSVHAAFQALTTDSPYDAAEISTAFYIALRGQRELPFVALPVFPSRGFRYGNLFVRGDSALTAVEDLRGKRVGLPEYGMTMGVWLRGIFSDVHGVSPREIDWVTARDPVLTDVPASVSAAGISVTRLPSGTLWEALAEGRIDAAIGVAPRDGLVAGSIRRLRTEYWIDDLEYFRRTGNFPVMHALVVRNSVVENDPGAVETLFRAFCAAKQRALAELADSLATLPVSLPLLTAHAEFSAREFGPDWWPYGLEANRTCVETLIRYCREQALIDRDILPEELFHPGSHGLTG
jgi:4,5-dihydroxyphthalate decarboxylase